MRIYLDTDYRCHASNDGTMTAVETSFFDGMCNTFIEGYRYIPEGETWTRSDGVKFTGEMIAPIADYRILANAQGEVVTLSAAGAAQVQAHCKDTGDDPAADTGIFVKGVEAWEAGKTYAANDLFSYEGSMGFVKQGHISQETWIPFTPGTESLYGARPAPDADGVFPWVYNMAAGVGMRVKDPDDGNIYACTQAISTMLYKPHEIPAHFEKE